MGLRRFGLATALVVLIGLLLAPAAGATFHLIKVREVYLGSALSPESKYVELQMYASGQNLVKGHTMRTYDASGAVIGNSTLAANVARDDNQSTILIATQQAAEQFGVAPDATLDEPGKLLAGGGAACWEAFDCVAWGNFAGSLPSPAGPPAAPSGIPDGMALRRSIDANCATAARLRGRPRQQRRRLRDRLPGATAERGRPERGAAAPAPVAALRSPAPTGPRRGPRRRP